MSTTNRNLKAYVRYDGSGRVVAGSLVLRKNKPKVGRWKEIQAYECCNYIPPVNVVLQWSVDEFPFGYPSVRLICIGGEETYYYTGEPSAADVNELVDELNNSIGTNILGVYSVIDELTVQLLMPISLKNELCPDGRLAFQLFND